MKDYEGVKGTHEMMESFGDVIADAAAGVSLTGLALTLGAIMLAFAVLRRRRRDRGRALAARARAGYPQQDVAAQRAPVSRGEWANRLRARASNDGDAPTEPAPELVAILGGADDPAARLQTVAASDFRVHPLLTRAQARLLPALERITYTRGNGHRLMAHTRLGDVVQPVAGHGTTPERLARAMRALHGQSLEFALFDGAGMLVAVIEVRTHATPGARRDIELALRREVLRKAGVALHIIPPQASEAEIEALLLPHLAPVKAG